MSYTALVWADVRKELRYDKRTGLFYIRKTGKPTGWPHKCRAGVYIRLRVGGVRVFAHTLAHFYCTGEWAPFVDHKDRNTTNNRWRNLRAATHVQNQFNRKVYRTSKSGHKGVRRVGKRWNAGIWIDGRRKSLGTFTTLRAAKAAYAAAALIHQGDFSYDHNNRKSYRRQRVGGQHPNHNNGVGVSACDSLGIHDAPSL